MVKGKGKQVVARPKASKGPRTRSQLDIVSHLKQEVAAHVLGVSSRTLRDAVNAPRLPDGDYDLRVLLAWWIEREKKKQSFGPSPAKERILEARACALERQNAIHLGRLTDIDSAAHTWRWVLNALATRLEAVAATTSPDVANAIAAAIDGARTQFMQAFPDLAKEDRPAPPALARPKAPELPGMGVAGA